MMNYVDELRKREHRLREIMALVDIEAVTKRDEAEFFAKCANRIIELESLVKRHEAALEWLSVTQDYDSLHKNHKTKMYALCKLGALGQDDGISMAMFTPLAAIESVMSRGEELG